MARKIGLSILVFLVVFCIGLSLVTTAGAILILKENNAVPAEVTPTPQSSVVFFS